MIIALAVGSILMVLLLPHTATKLVMAKVWAQNLMIFAWLISALVAIVSLIAAVLV